MCYTIYKLINNAYTIIKKFLSFVNTEFLIVYRSKFLEESAKKDFCLAKCNMKYVDLQKKIIKYKI